MVKGGAVLNGIFKRRDAAMAAFLKGKKFILCAIAVIMAAIAAIVAVSFTYAAYRRDVLSQDGATVAGAIAEYERGEAFRNNVKIDIVEENGSFSVSELSPGDLFTYNFSVNNSKGEGEEVRYNEVLLKITCSFTFTYSYLNEDENGNVTVIQQSLSAMQILSQEDGTVEVAPNVFFIFGDSKDSKIVTEKGDVPGYYDPENPSEVKAVQQTDTIGGIDQYTQKIGFFLYPAQTDSGVNALSQQLGFYVLVPSQTAASEEYGEFRLNVSIKVYAEQVTNTNPGETS